MTRGAINCESPRRAGAGRRPAFSARSRTVEAGGEMEVFWGGRRPCRPAADRRRAVRWWNWATISCTNGKVISNAEKQAVAVVYVNRGGMR
jgi:hypothetical protein